MSSIKLKNIKQTVIGGTTQPLKLGGILDDGSDAVITIDTNKVLSGVAVNYTATLPYTSWTGSSAPYSKVVSVVGLLSTDYPNFDVVTSGTYTTDILRKDEWSKVYAWVTSTDTITFYATEVPTIDLPLMIKVVR